MYTKLDGISGASAFAQKLTSLSDQVARRRCLKSKWPGSVPGNGWRPFSFVARRKKGLGRIKQ